LLKIIFLNVCSEELSWIIHVISVYVPIKFCFYYFFFQIRIYICIYSTCIYICINVYKKNILKVCSDHYVISYSCYIRIRLCIFIVFFKYILWLICFVIMDLS
jgi:hypothetical protein